MRQNKLPSRPSTGPPRLCPVPVDGLKGNFYPDFERFFCPEFEGVFLELPWYSMRNRATVFVEPLFYAPFSVWANRGKIGYFCLNFERFFYPDFEGIFSAVLKGFFGWFKITFRENI